MKLVNTNVRHWLTLIIPSPIRKHTHYRPTSYNARPDNEQDTPYQPFNGRLTEGGYRMIEGY